MLERVLGTLEYTDEHTYAHNGKDFTGINFYINKQEQVTEELSYFEGMKWGFYRKWNSNGVLLKLHTVNLDGNGRSKKWYGNKVLQEDCFYDSGSIVWRKRWDQQGNLIEDFNIMEDPNGENYIYWKKIQSLKEQGKAYNSLLPLEIQEVRAKWDEQVKHFEEEIANYLEKFPSNKVYYLKDFVNFLLTTFIA
ncbi:MAG TPA: hypothetical protein V6D15_16255 [Oculatellaceae cyanobacterium]|jgi:hypothetical protein